MQLIITQPEYDTVLAALRFYQGELEGRGLTVATVEEIATNAGQHEPMDAQEIDVLIQEMQFGHRDAAGSDNPEPDATRSQW